MRGDLPTARRELEKVEPTLLTSLDATRAQSEAALFAGALLTREGRSDDAKRLLEGLLAAQAPPQQGYDPVSRKLIRAKALAQLGRADAALDELRAAYQQGNRIVWDFDNFQRLDHEPSFASLRDDARFRAIVAQMEADNRAMRERILHSTASKES